MIFAGECEGYKMYLLGAGWNCPTLKLYGYATLRQLKTAIRRVVKKRREGIE